jgi:hypothetical protein
MTEPLSNEERAALVAGSSKRIIIGLARSQRKNHKSFPDPPWFPRRLGYIGLLDGSRMVRLAGFLKKNRIRYFPFQAAV